MHGGDDGTRTHDLLVANQALYQLSYVPAGSVVAASSPPRVRGELVGLGGLEPPTLRLSGVRSNHLSYRPPRPVDTGKRARFRSASRRDRVASSVACRARVLWLPRPTPGRSLSLSPGGLDFLRKEVIQPQVPLRLPCYDLVPVTGPAVAPFGAFQALPASMT